jgi:Protein of unknown function (DUF4244)
MTRQLARIKEEAGLSTAEYTVGTVAVTGLGALLYKILTSDWMMALLKQVVEWAFHAILGG